jgi:hypothetical protein
MPTIAMRGGASNDSGMRVAIADRHAQWLRSFRPIHALRGSSPLFRRRRQLSSSTGSPLPR